MTLKNLKKTKEALQDEKSSWLSDTIHEHRTTLVGLINLSIILIGCLGVWTGDLTLTDAILGVSFVSSTLMTVLAFLSRDAASVHREAKKFREMKKDIWDQEH